MTPRRIGVLLQSLSQPYGQKMSLDQHPVGLFRHTIGSDRRPVTINEIVQSDYV